VVVYINVYIIFDDAVSVSSAGARAPLSFSFAGAVDFVDLFFAGVILPRRGSAGHFGGGC
jgi:hypothetical protein